MDYEDRMREGLPTWIEDALGEYEVESEMAKEVEDKED